MDVVVATIWIVTLLTIVLVMVPLILPLCFRLVKASYNIRHHFEVTLEAAVGVVGNTAPVTALADTITVAGGMLETAGSIDAQAASIEGLLVGRLKGTA